MSDRADVPLQGDIAGPGVRKIAAAAGLPYTITRGLIDAGHLPAFKIGERWYARRSEMDAVLSATGRNKDAGKAREA